MTLDITTRARFARFRRLRRSEGLRRLMRETTLSPSDFVYPLFVVHGQDVREEIPSMPGQYHLSLDRLAAEAEELRSLGIPAVLLFGLPASKDDVGSEAYAAKYASAFYGPFREAAESAPAFGDRRGYQMDPPNAREALREIEADIAEGADIIMVKPALPYLDVLSRARQRFDLPLAAYNVSGEYAMVHAAARNGWLDGPRVVLEILTAIKRAVADIIITYHAKAAARWLAEQR